MREDLRNGEKSIGFVIADAVTGDVNGAHLTIDHFVSRGDALIDRRGKGDDLEDRARLVERAYRAIHTGLRGTAAWRIGIKLRPAGHGQDLAIRGVLDQNGAGLRVGLFNGGSKLFFDDELDIFVDGQNNARTRFGSLVGALIPTVMRVGEDEHARGFAANAAIELVFDSADPFLINVDVTENGRGQIALGIKALIFLLEIDAAQIQLPNVSHGRGRQLARDPYEGTRRTEARGNLVGRQA